MRATRSSFYSSCFTWAAAWRLLGVASGGACPLRGTTARLRRLQAEARPGPRPAVLRRRSCPSLAPVLARRRSATSPTAPCPSPPPWPGCPATFALGSPRSLRRWIGGRRNGPCSGSTTTWGSWAVSRSTRSTSSWGPSGCEAGGGMSCSGAFARSRWWEIGCSWTITTISKRGSGSCTSASTALGSTAKRHCGSAMGFCGVTVGIKPSFLQLCSQCFLQPLLCISGPAPRSCCCARPELFGSSAALVTSHVLLTVPACIFWLLSESLLSERFWPGFQLPFNLY